MRRARPKDRIQAGDGNGRLVEASIESISEGRVEATVLSAEEVPRPFPAVTVLHGLARQGKIDFALQKLAELGVDRMVVFHVSRSVPQWDEAKRVKILRRWERICYEASKQSHRAWLPRIDGPMDLDAAVDASRGQELCLIADPLADRALRSVLPAGDAPRSVGVVVGPEGGLEQSEVASFSAAGGKAVSFGGQILRTETAGIAIAAALMFHFGRLG